MLWTRLPGSIIVYYYASSIAQHANHINAPHSSQKPHSLFPLRIQRSNGRGPEGNSRRCADVFVLLCQLGRFVPRVGAGVQRENKPAKRSLCQSFVLLRCKKLARVPHPMTMTKRNSYNQCQCDLGNKDNRVLFTESMNHPFRVTRID